MVTLAERPHAIRFGFFEMDLDERQLRKKGSKLKLQAQPFRVLEFLALHAGVTVSREDLYCLLSSHSSYDSKHALNNAVQKIREVLGDSAGTPRFVETVAGRGYRFVCPAEVITTSAADGQSEDAAHVASIEDPFLLEVRRIRRELLGSASLSELRELWHRTAAVLATERSDTHPNRHEATLLKEQIEQAIEWGTAGRRDQPTFAAREMWRQICRPLIFPILAIWTIGEVLRFYGSHWAYMVPPQPAFWERVWFATLVLVVVYIALVLGFLQHRQPLQFMNWSCARRVIVRSAQFMLLAGSGWVIIEASQILIRVVSSDSYPRFAFVLFPNFLLLIARLTAASLIVIYLILEFRKTEKCLCLVAT